MPIHVSIHVCRRVCRHVYEHMSARMPVRMSARMSAHMSTHRNQKIDRLHVHQLQGADCQRFSAHDFELDFMSCDATTGDDSTAWPSGTSDGLPWDAEVS